MTVVVMVMAVVVVMDVRMRSVQCTALSVHILFHDAHNVVVQILPGRTANARNTFGSVAGTGAAGIDPPRFILVTVTHRDGPRRFHRADHRRAADG
jgi:hypothetical protein